MINYNLYNEMINKAINHIENANAELIRLENITEFESLTELERYKHDKLDTEAKKEIFTDLLHSLKEALEFEEYENIF